MFKDPQVYWLGHSQSTENEFGHCWFICITGLFTSIGLLIQKNQRDAQRTKVCRDVIIQTFMDFKWGNTEYGLRW